MKSILLAIAIVLGLQGLALANPCGIQSQPNDVCKCKIDNLHPTQMSVGLIEVRLKEEDLRNSHHPILEKKRSIPIVVGPVGQLYIVDHHHLARAYFELRISEGTCEVLANFSEQSVPMFWQEMEQRHWIYPYDENGKGPYPVTAIPSKIEDLKDDPYRSLAGAVRDAGGFEKSMLPFSEFKWANFFRSRIHIRYIGNTFDPSVVEEAKSLAQSPEASDLPGYTGQHSEASPSPHSFLFTSSYSSLALKYINDRV